MLHATLSCWWGRGDVVALPVFSMVGRHAMLFVEGATPPAQLFVLVGQ